MGCGFRHAALVLSQRIALYPDVGAFPLWFLDEDGREIANADPRALPISTELRAALSAWARRSDENHNEEYDVLDAEVEDGLAEDARRLAAEVSTELGPDYVVTCYADR